jgi:hypothetical protein
MRNSRVNKPQLYLSVCGYEVRFAGQHLALARGIKLDKYKFSTGKSGAGMMLRTELDQRITSKNKVKR